MHAIFDIASIVIVLAAAFAHLYHKLPKLPHTIGLVVSPPFGAIVEDIGQHSVHTVAARHIIRRHVGLSSGQQGHGRTIGSAPAMLRKPFRLDLTNFGADEALNSEADPSVRRPVRL